MKGTANVPGKKASGITPEKIGAQAKLTGAEGQFVGFDKKGNAVAKSALSGKETQYIGFDAEGKQVAKDMPEGSNPSLEGLGAQAKLQGTEGQFVGFDEEGNAVPRDLSEISVERGFALFGTIGTEWTEDPETGAKYQLVQIEGVLASHTAGVLDVIMTHERTSEGYAAFVEENNQFLAYITNGDAETVDGGVMFYVYGEVPTVEIPFCLEVV